MKRLGSPRRLRAALPLLAMAVLLTVPATATASKYVWQDTIDITLKVVYPESVITSLLPEGHPSEFWVQELTNIAAAPTAEGLVLTAAEGYVLPETITVKIGQQTFSVRTDGTRNPVGITFQPETGLLSIQEALIEQNPGGITVQAAAEEKADDPGNSSAGQSDPAPNTTAASGSAAPEGQPPQTGSVPTGETTPAEPSDPVPVPSTTEVTPPAEPSDPAPVPPATEAVAPTESSDPDPVPPAQDNAAPAASLASAAPGPDGSPEPTEPSGETPDPAL